MVIGMCGLADGKGASRLNPELSGEQVCYKKHCTDSACCVSEIT